MNKQIRKIQEKYKTKQTTEYLENLQSQIQTRLIRLVNKKTKQGRLSRRDLTDFDNFLVNTINRYLKKETRRVRVDLSQLYANVYRDILKLYGINYKTPRTLISKELLFPWSGQTFDERMRGNIIQYHKGLDRILKMINKGKGLDEVLEALNKIDKKCTDRHLLLQQVESEHFVNMASQQAFKKAGVIKVVWYTRQDERVCPVCGALHGKEFEVTRIPTIPQHPNCRCRIVTLE